MSVSIGLGPDGELRYPHHQPDESDHSQLLSHGDRLLSLASSTFKDSSISISGRVPLVHSWDRNGSVHGLDSYDGVSKIFSRNSCGMILPGWTFSIRAPRRSSSCIRHGVSVSSENSLASSTSGDVLDRIEKKLHSDASSSVDKFTYQRMGASFFLPEHFALFVRFSRCLNLPVRWFNDVAVRDGRDDEFFLDPRRLQTA
ncbi:beta-amylase [Orobanche minor]